ncbi:exonuclease 1-like [Macrobrachium nipponense]|uniref:exonuclease 1-like n=1 Tax=Macrobrachium nipponense TaxID=159736 RepID=UPI0030C84084
MGIQGLLPFLKKASRPANLRDFKGQTAAVDAYCWLHKGAFSCADKLVRGEPTDGYVMYVMKQINLFLNNDIKPILVFDGCHLPSKAVTERKRRENRERNQKRAKELLREGRVKEAKECFQRCVDITSEMAAEVIAACRARNVDIIVAPYEADAQLAYLNACGIAQLVVTEDSDLVLFGCKYILFKMDYQGNGILIEQEKLHLGMSVPRDKFSFDKFRNICILSGCDYLPSLPGIGLAKACKFFNVTSNPDLHNVLCKLPSYLKMPQLEVTQEYRDGFIKARNTFLYQLVFDPIERLLKPLNDYPDGTGPGDFPYAGKFIGHDRALQVALGNVNVQTGETVDNFDPECYQPPEMKSSGWDKKGNICPTHPSMWKKDFTPKKFQPPIPNLGVTEREVTKGKEVVVPTAAVKRKREVTEENLPTEITEGDLQSMYGVAEKKMKLPLDSVGEQPSQSVGEEVKEEEEEEDDTCGDALDLLSNALDAEENTNEISPEEDDQKEPEVQKSKNPFAKAQLPKKNSQTVGQFSALKRFSNIRKTVVDPNTIVQSRYFSSSLPSKSVAAKEESSDGSVQESFVTCDNKDLPSAVQMDEIDDENKSDKNDRVECINSDNKTTENIECETAKEQNKSKTNDTECYAKAPLSPVQTNSMTPKPEKTFKWGKLSDMFSYKGNKTEISSSPSARNSFKPVVTSQSVPCTPVSRKENEYLSVVVDPLESTSLSQKSCASEVSIASNIGSIDNDSFDLTPSSTPDSSQNSQGKEEKRNAQDEKRASNVKLTSPLSRMSSAKSRPVGLSKPRGKAQKQTDAKQRNLRDMFAFKKDTTKLLSSRPSL